MPKPPEREVVLRGALHPQQLFRSQLSRKLDVGAGYRVDVTRDTPTIHGPYFETAVLPLRFTQDGRVTRLGLRNMGELLFDPEGGGQFGWGATLALSAELASFVSGAGAEGGGGGFVAGAAHGEFGVGAFAGVTHRQLGSDELTMFTAGLSGRIPATAALICCGSIK